MPIETIEFKGEKYLSLQTKGFAARYIFEFAKQFCVGNGVDVGPSKKEWTFPGAIPVDLSFDDFYDAFNLPEGLFDYIFASHSIEHLCSWTEALTYWHTKLDKGGVLFLYVPHRAQLYWHPASNTKHVHVLDQQMFRDYFKIHSSKFKNIFISEGYDLYHSFVVVAEKK